MDARTRPVAHDLLERGITRPALDVWPEADRAAARAAGFRVSEVSAPLGAGDDVWRRVTHDLLRWRVKTASGFRVHPEPTAAVEVDALLTITARVLAVTITEPVEVVEVVDEARRVGFAYRTRPGHPVAGEEAFVVHRDGGEGDGAGRGGDVVLTIRSLTAPAPQQPWRALHPILRLAQLVARRRYLRALR
ncbi:DUF1990 family protein [Schumannella sp. 10F1B-5-1]|uniref:DUF1990 family protein n=1 Tax=Schumannella sp. 10F1B-5-1 TaxID=2590780 RepID=UPI00113225AF|nr:DUF1990 family protein [Schumannella sp. 10F1B-5-1]TPW73620.1 DUF1990 family protein [Schumannella sp. 10F1B-5-1]